MLHYFYFLKLYLEKHIFIVFKTLKIKNKSLLINDFLFFYCTLKWICFNEDSVDSRIKCDRDLEDGEGILDVEYVELGRLLQQHLHSLPVHHHHNSTENPRLQFWYCIDSSHLESATTASHLWHPTVVYTISLFHLYWSQVDLRLLEKYTVRRACSDLEKSELYLGLKFSVTN